MGDSAPEVISLLCVGGIDSQNEVISRSSPHSSSQQTRDDDVDDLLLLGDVGKRVHFGGSVGLRDVDSVWVILSDGVLRVVVADAFVVVFIVISVESCIAIFDAVW